jgi:hypothetical protein
VGRALQHELHAGNAQDIGDFVRIGNRRNGPVHHGSPAKLARDEKRAFDMDVSVDEAGEDVGIALAADFANLGDATASHRHFGGKNPLVVDVDKVRRDAHLQSS